MCKTIIFLSFIALSISQTEITIYRTSANLLMNKIEEEIINNTFELYNKNNSEKLTYKFHNVVNFGNMLKQFDLKAKYNPDHIMLVNRITVTSAREVKYLFSSIYAPGKEVLVKRISDKRPLKLNENTKIIFIKNTAHEKSMRFLKNKYSIIPILVNSTREMYQKLENEKYDYGIADNVSIWEKQNYEIVHEIEYQNGKGFGIMYPKISKLRDKLDRYLLYYLRSNRFKKLLTKSYGKFVREYFLKALLKSQN